MSPIGSAGGARRGQRVAAVQEVARGEVLKQVADGALDRQGQEDGPGKVLLRVLGLLTHGRHRFKAHQDQDRDAGLYDDVAEVVWPDDRLGRGMVVEGLNTRGIGRVGGVLVVDREGSCLFHGRGLAVGIGGQRVAVLVRAVLHLVGGRAVGVLGRLSVCVKHRQWVALVVVHRHLCDLVVDRNPVREVIGLRTLRVRAAVGQRDHREDHERGDLDNVDRDVDRRAPVHTAVRDVGHAESEHDAEEVHLKRAVVDAAEGVGKEIPREISHEHRRDAHHASRVDPVVQVTRPPREELGQARELERLGLREERLLGIEIR